MRDKGRKGVKLIFTRQNRNFCFDRDMAIQFLGACSHGLRPSAAASALKQHFAHSPTSCYAKDRAQLDEAWQTGDRKKRCQLLKSGSFLRMLDESQANEILDDPHPALLHCLYRGIRQSPMGVLPPSPKLYLKTRIKLMLAALAAHEPELGKAPEAKIRERIRTNAAMGMAADEFAPEHMLEDFLQCLPSAKFMDSPSSMLAHAPVDMALSLLLRRYIWNQEDSLSSWKLQQRHGLWERVLLKTDAGECDLSLSDLLTICACCDLEKADPELVSALFEIGHPLVREKIIYSDLLNQAQRDRAWQQGDVKVCRELLKLPVFFEELTDCQARDIIALGDTHMLQHLAGKIRYLYIRWEEIEGRRLAPEIRDKLLKALLESPDPHVHRLLDTAGIPEEIVMRIKASIEGQSAKL